MGRCKTSPGLGVLVSDEHPVLIVRNTFLEIPMEEPAFLDIRRVRSAPCSPVGRDQTEPCSTRLTLSLAQLTVDNSSKIAEKTTFPALSLASMIETPGAAAKRDPTKPQVGGSEIPTVGS